MRNNGLKKSIFSIFLVFTMIFSSLANTVVSKADDLVTEDKKTTRENTVNDNYGIKYRYDWPNNWMYNNIVPRARFKDGYTTMIKAEKKNTSNDNIIVYSDITTFEGNEVDGSKIYVRNANIPLMNDSTGVEVYARKTQASPWEDISSSLSGTSLSLTAGDGYGALKIVYKNVSTVGEVEIKINFAPTTQLVNEVMQRPMNAAPADITSYIGLTVQDATTSNWAWEYDGVDYLIKDYPKKAKATEIGQAQSSYQGIDTSKYRTVNEDGKEIEVLRGTGYQNDWTQNDSPNLRVLDWLSLRNVPGNSVAWDKDNLQYDIKHNGPIYMPGGMQNLPINDATYVMYLPKNIFLDESFVAGSKVMWAERIGDQVAQEVKTEMITLDGVERQKVTITMSFTGEWLASNAVWKDIPLYTTDLETYKPGTSFSYPTRLVVNGIYNVSGTDLNYHELDWNHKNNTGTWYKDELGSGMTPDKSKLVDNGVNDWVFAVDAAGKIPDGCTITYDVNGGTGEQTDDTKYIIDTEVIFKDEGTMVKDGAKFVGWNTKADGTGTPYAVGATINISNNMVLYAQWVNIYTVEYDGNGNTSGVVPTDASEYELNQDVTVKNENTLEKVNFLFNGWNTQADGKGTHYNVDDIFKITGNMKLYAEWKIPEPGEIFRVTYDGNGNTGGTVPTDVSRYFKDDIVIVKGENTLVRTGYKFLGWNTDKNANSAIYKEDEQFNVAENTILYAIWERIPTDPGEPGGTIKDITLVGGRATLTDKMRAELSNFKQHELYGKDRYATSVQVSKSYKNSDTVVLASGEKYTDELTATVLASKLDVPILLSEKDIVQEVVMNEIERLGATKVILIGEKGTLSKSVETQLSKYKLERIGGVDRYETSVLIGDQVRTITGNKTQSILVDGTNFPDAIAMTSMGVEQGLPIILTQPNELNKITEKAVKDWGITKVTIGGGTASVSSNIENTLKATVEVDRISGSDRYETSVLVAKQVYKNPTHAVVASGEVFPDAIVGAPYAAKNKYPIVLSRGNSVPQVVLNYVNGK